MSDESDDLEDDTPEPDPEQIVCLPWEGGDIVITNAHAFSLAYSTVAIRCTFKTGDLEVLSSDGKQWTKLGRPLKAVSK